MLQLFGFHVLCLARALHLLLHPTSFLSSVGLLQLLLLILVLHLLVQERLVVNLRRSHLSLALYLLCLESVRVFSNHDLPQVKLGARIRGDLLSPQVTHKGGVHSYSHGVVPH